MKTSNLIEQDFGVITAHASLAEIVQVIKKSKRNLFAVVSKKGELEGILTLDDVREVMFEVKLYDKIFVEDIMKKPPSVLHVRESMSDVMRKFDATDAWNLPVVEGNQYVGFISKSAIFSQYRSQLSALSDTDE